MTAPRTPAAAPDQKLIALLAEARHAQQLVLANPDKTLSSLAKTKGICRKRLGQLVVISCLAPDVVAAVVEGTQPAGLSAQRLMQVDLPMGWDHQRQALGLGKVETRNALHGNFGKQPHAP